MSLLSQEVLDDVRELITEVTKFQEEDENFTICERYCISHVMHHTYPSVSRSSVKNMITSYISRFYSQGYFKVSEELDYQVKIFLSNEKLFEKNPEYDIQWCLLSLLCSLSSNLTSVKNVPKLLPVDEEEEKPEVFDWKEYLTKDLPPRYSLEELTSSSEENSEEEDEETNDEVQEKSQQESEPKPEQPVQGNKNIEILFDNIDAFRNQVSLENQKRLIVEFISRRKSKSDLGNDCRLRGNITEKIENVLSQEGIIRKTQFLSEFEIMENILYQFQSGEKILLRKGLVNPALTSITQDTLCDYLESLQPYFIIIRCFKDFNDEVTKARYPENILVENFQNLKTNQSSPSLHRENWLSGRTRKVSNVLYIYNVMLKKALEPFQNELTAIVENLDSYTLLKMERKLRPYYFFLTSLFSVHKEATQNWANDKNWMSSLRVLSVLHNAIMNSTSTKMSLLYLNLFLHCFQVYLDIIDAWIAFVDLKDPNDDFIVARCQSTENGCSEYEIRAHKTEIENSGIQPVPLIDSIAEKMVQVGQSLDILRKLNRFVPQKTPKETSFEILTKTIQEKLTAFGEIKPIPKKVQQEKHKQKGIFTVKNTSFGLKRDGGGGDSVQMDTILKEVLKEEEGKRKEERPGEEKVKKEESSYREFIYSVIGNPFFKAAFDDVGVRQVQRKLEEAKRRKGEESGGETLFLVKIPDGGERGLYPFHKIIWEAFHKVMENGVFSACALVKDIVLRECDLPAHLSLFRSLLLFNNSYLIQSFILTVFTQPAIWNSSYSLTFHLKDCLRGLYKDHVNALTVTSAKSTSIKCDNVLQVIDVMTVNYEVKWPLNLVFTSDVVRKYNEIFRLALKLKWAHWALCRQHFHREKPILRRVQLLKFWFLSDLGRINNYFMAQMVPHDLELDTFHDFKDIIHGHAAFVNEIHRNCLLGKESSEKRKLIFDGLLPLCMELSQAETSITETKLSEIEKDFGHCHNKLSCLMSSLENK